MNPEIFDAHEPMSLPGIPATTAPTVAVPTVLGPRSAAVLCVLLTSVTASWSLCARGLGLSWRTILAVFLASLAGLGVSLGVLSLRGISTDFLRRLARAGGGLAVAVALLSLLLKAGWFPAHAGWGGLFLTLMPVAVGGLAWMAWRRLGWLRPPLPATTPEEAAVPAAVAAPEPEAPRLAESA